MCLLVGLGGNGDEEELSLGGDVGRVARPNLLEGVIRPGEMTGGRK